MSEKLLLIATKSFSALQGFVEGENLRIAINGIVGDIHMEAAKDALEMAKISNSPSDRIKSAINHLEAAHIAFKRIYTNRNLIEKYLPTITAAAKLDQLYYASLKDAYVLCIMACCYSYLGDYAASAKVIALAEKAYSGGDDSNMSWYDFATYFAVGTGAYVINQITGYTSREKAKELLATLALDRNEFAEFQKGIEVIHKKSSQEPPKIDPKYKRESLY